jgi:hypothetical protein
MCNIDVVGTEFVAATAYRLRSRMFGHEGINYLSCTLEITMVAAESENLTNLIFREPKCLLNHVYASVCCKSLDT